MFNLKKKITSIEIWLTKEVNFKLETEQIPGFAYCLGCLQLGIIRFGACIQID